MSELHFVSRDYIDKGWSGDKKYCVTTADGTKYLLRITPEDKSAGRADMFRLQQEVAALGISMCQPILFRHWTINRIGKCALTEKWIGR